MTFKSSEKPVLDIFKDFGLTEKEAEVYVFLARGGAQRGGILSKSLGMHKAQMYHILKILQDRGMVETTLEAPRRFIAVPLEQVMDLIVKAKKAEASSLEGMKNEILAYWKSIAVGESELDLEKFSTIRGLENIHCRISQILSKAKKEILEMLTSTGMAQADRLGTLDQAMTEVEKRGIRSRWIIEVTKENLEIAKKICEVTSKKHLNFGLRCPTSVPNPSVNFIVRDRGEAIFFTTTEEKTTKIRTKDIVGLWTNNNAFVQSLVKTFQTSWHNSIDAHLRILEIEKGKSILVVDDDNRILRVYQNVLQSAGYGVDTAETGEEALEKTKAEFYHLALLDIKLPDIEGTELLAELRKAAPKMIKVMITGYPELENAVKSLNLGADAYIIKPVRMEELLRVVEEQLCKQEEIDLATSSDTFVDT